MPKEFEQPSTIMKLPYQKIQIQFDPFHFCQHVSTDEKVYQKFQFHHQRVE